jgi:glycoside/pentoside/hexuronide:cation symporter, GPH family
MLSSSVRPTTVQPAIGLGTKLSYGLGSIAFGVKDNGFGLLLMLYYNQVLGLPAGTVGAALMIALLADAFIDPIVGHLSDHWHSRWGRRHPFMYAAALPASLCYLAVWNPPAGWTQPQLFLYLVGTAIVIRALISFYEVPSAALAPELTVDYDQRTSLLSFRFFFGWCGGLGMGVLAFQVFLVPDAQHPVGQLNPAGYSKYGLCASLVMLASMLTSAAATHRHIPRLAAPPRAQPFDMTRILSEAKATLWNRAFLTTLGNCMCGAMALGLAAGLVIYINTYFWELSGMQIALLMLGNVLSAAGALAIAPRLSRRFEKKKALIATTLASMVVGPLPLLLRLAGQFPANHSPLLVPVLLVATIVTITLTITSSILATSMMADVVEDSQIKTGRRSEGLFFSASAFVYKCVSGIGIGGTGLILSLASFPDDAKPGQVPLETLQRLAWMQIACMTVLYLLAIAFARLYPLSRAAHQANLKRLGILGRRSSDPEHLLALADRSGVRSSLRPGP